MRAYSRLNWLELSYPTSKAAVVTDVPPVFRSRLASSRRSSFWYCSGVVDVSNFNIKHIEELKAAGLPMPAANQIES